jgi:hypothetical protein
MRKKRTVEEEVVQQFWKSMYLLMRDRFAVSGGIVIPHFCSIQPNESGIIARKNNPHKSEAYRTFLADWEESVIKSQRKRPVKQQVEIRDREDVLAEYGSLDGWICNPDGKYERTVKRTKNRNHDF